MSSSQLAITLWLPEAQKRSFEENVFLKILSLSTSEFHRLAVKRRGSDEGKDSNGGLGRDD